MCKRKLLTGSNNFSQKDLCLQRSGLGLNRNPAKSRSVLDQGLWVRVQWTLSRYLMRSVLVQQTNCTPALWSSCCDWDRKKMYFHNILDAIKCQQVIWSILCDHDDSLQWALVSGQEGQPLTQKTPKCFPCCLLNTKIVLQVQLSWNCLFFREVSSKTSPFKRQSEVLLSQYSSVWFYKTVLLDHQIDVQWMFRRQIGFFCAYFALQWCSYILA